MLAVSAVGTAQAQDFEPGIQDLTDAEMSQLDSNPEAVDIRFGRVYECRARNARGQVFEAQARSRVQAQRRALNRCYSFRSARCNVVSCQSKWAIGFGNDRDDRRWDDDRGGWGRGGRGRR